MDSEFEAEFNRAMNNARIRMNEFVKKELIYFREHGHARPKTELEVFKETHFMCKAKSGALVWYNPQTMICYKTYGQSGNYEPYFPLIETGEQFERAISGFDF